MPTTPKIDEDFLKKLSSLLYPLGDQIEEIWAQLEQAGLGTASAAVRSLQLEFAESDDARAKLLLFWREYAKERLACLAGPCNIERGNFIPQVAYRSQYLDALRREALLAGPEGRLPHGFIEPTLARFFYMPSSHLMYAEWGERPAKAIQSALAKRSIKDVARFAESTPQERHELLVQRYKEKFAAHGFMMLEGRKILVFARQLEGHPLAFMMINDSDNELDSQVRNMFAIGNPNKQLRARGPCSGAIARFSETDVVPEFQFDASFKLKSYASFCLAIDNSVFLANVLFERIQQLVKHKWGQQLSSNFRRFDHF